MAQLCESQKTLSERIFKLQSNTKKTSKSRYTLGYIQTRIETLESYWSKYQTQYEMIKSTVTKTELEQLQFNTESLYETTEDIYLEFKGFLKDYLLEFSKSQGQPTQSLLRTNDGETTPIRAKLPPLSIPKFADTTKECLNSLDNLGVDTSTWDAIIVHLVVSKLDLETHKQWEQSLGSSQDITTFTTLSLFLENRFRSMEMGHSVNACRQSTNCRICSRRHHTLLHFTNPNKTTLVPESDAVTSSTPVTSQTTSTVVYKAEVDSDSEEVILATARIAVKSRNGDTIVLRALIDPCSQSNFVTEAAAQLLNLERTSISGKITGISSIPLTTKSQVTLNFHAIRNPSHMITAKAYVLRRINSRLPSQEIPPDTWPSSEISDLADPHFHMPGSIDVLLGAVVYAHIILNGIIKRNESLVALNSRLGWLVSGEVTQSGHQSHNVVVMHTQFEVDQLLRQFWEINEYSPNVKPLSKPEMQCEEHFKKTHTRNTDGRYEVRLPFKDEDAPNLGNSRQLALKRLLQMENKFKRRPEFHEEYCKFMRQYESLGHMEVVPETEKKNRAYHLPHHAVLRASSLTTKLRVVFDGSAKPVDGNSLNDELLIGPPLQQDIRELVTRWRQHKYCIVADIQQMYRQILISKQDTDYQRILWRESSEDPITYRHIWQFMCSISCHKDTSSTCRRRT
ncbi:unnamed protein product [Pieris macdunnoughi]|uniref:Peptidase aspartic putative domain-containing protein n=1 Tax=Pieris macdunnoughi TaxID=345717 RepID=A0A821SET1_9NEOP|nr:unnamed protein product [Pieris macdunnoughi]